MSQNIHKSNDAEMEARLRNEYAARFGMVNILTPEEKAKYSTFAQKVHNLNHNDLFKLNMGVADELTSEQKDIVAFEIKIREIEALKSKKIDPKVAFSAESNQKHFQKKAEIDFFEHNGDENLNRMEMNSNIVQGYRLNERQRISEMTDELLEQSRKIANDHPKVIKRDKLHDKNGGGINMTAEKFIYEDDNGEKILINNKKLQEHFRKMYIKRLSDVTGIDYTRYDEDYGLDLSIDNDLVDTLKDDPTNGWGPSTNQDNKSYADISIEINENDYEDD